MLCKQMRPVTGENVYVELLTDGAEHMMSFERGEQGTLRTHTSQPPSALLTRFTPTTRRPMNRLFSRMLRVLLLCCDSSGLLGSESGRRPEVLEERGPWTRTRWSSTRRSV